jgi:nucleoside-diphosphate-sugar epimerase
MRVFVAGASGALGKILVPLLTSNGHQVTGTTRTPANIEALRSAGADPIVCDGLNRNAVVEAVVAAKPHAIIHQMSALAQMRSLKNFDAEFALTNRLRTEGTENLIEAAKSAGVGKILVQSYTGWPNAPEGGRIKTEEDPLDPNPPKSMSQTLAAIRHLETLVQSVTNTTGVVLRYGSFYGPGTSTTPGGELLEAVRHRKFPVVGSGAGVWSFTHIRDAAAATLLALEIAPPGLYNIVDDDPAEVSIWLPDLAKAIGAKPPRHVPVWLGKLFIGKAGVAMMTTSRGSSNTKAKRTLGWDPIFKSWRDGFRNGLSA